MNEESIFHKGFWVQLSIICGLIAFIMGCAVTMVNASQSRQDNMIYSHNQKIEDLTIKEAKIEERTNGIAEDIKEIKEDGKEMNKKLDTLLSRGS